MFTVQTTNLAKQIRLVVTILLVWVATPALAEWPEWYRSSNTITLPTQQYRENIVAALEQLQRYGAISAEQLDSQSALLPAIEDRADWQLESDSDIYQAFETGILSADLVSTDKSVRYKRGRTIWRPILQVLETADSEAVESQRATLESVKAEAEQFIWKAVVTLPNLESISEDSALYAWAQLGILYRDRDISLEQWPEQLATWSAKNKHHIAHSIADYITSSYRHRLQNQERIDAVAVLLPVTGLLASAGQEILEGIQASYFRVGTLYGWWPEIRLYDTAQIGVATAVNLAYAEGIRTFIGPVSSERVTAMLSHLQSLPEYEAVITLNQSQVLKESAHLPIAISTEPSSKAPKVWQYSLAVEDEISELIRFGRSRGWQRGGGLFIESEWGLRTILDFERRWTELDGVWLGAEGIPRSEDISNLGKRLLLVDDSERRIRSLARLINKSIEAQPRRRQDIDFIFMGVDSESAARFLSTLQFNYAKGVPVVTLSPSYMPESQDTHIDLLDVTFTDMPWMTQANKNLSDKQFDIVLSEYRYRNRFFAMGIDAWAMASDIAMDVAQTEMPIAGESGILTVKADGRVHRRPTLHVMQRHQSDFVPTPISPKSGEPSGSKIDSPIALAESE